MPGTGLISSRKVTSWIRANRKDFQLVKDIGLEETGILVSCSDYHIFYKMKMTRQQAMFHSLHIVRECLEFRSLYPAAIWRILQDPICLDLSFHSAWKLMRLQDQYKNTGEESCL